MKLDTKLRKAHTLLDLPLIPVPNRENLTRKDINLHFGVFVQYWLAVNATVRWLNGYAILNAFKMSGFCGSKWYLLWEIHKFKPLLCGSVLLPGCYCCRLAEHG